MARYDDARRVQQTLGPSIMGAIDFMDGEIGGERFVVEDDGFPNVLLNALRGRLDAGTGDDQERGLLDQIVAHVRDDERSRNLMVWLGAGMDAADGELSLERHLLRKTSTLALRWTPEQSLAVVDAIMAMHRRMTEATQGHLQPNAGWSLFKNLVTLHPLGGCRMGGDADTGVVNHLGEVFGYPRLFVADGAIIPTAIGRNPSHTIAALAERIARHID
jgi:cholesterol oxidase